MLTNTRLTLSSSPTTSAIPPCSQIRFPMVRRILQKNSTVTNYDLLILSILSSLETKSVSAKTGIISIDADTCYSCMSSDLIEAGLVNMTLSNVLMQAFVANGSKSENRKFKLSMSNYNCSRGGERKLPMIRLEFEIQQF